MRIKEMKTKLWLAVMMLASLYTTTAAAEMVIGVKGGKVDYDISGSDPGLNGSVQLAFDIFDIGIADIAVEGEISKTLVDGEIPGDEDLSFESAGLYLSLRTLGPIYVIARVGQAKTEVESSTGESVEDTNTSTGVGVGFSMGARLELEYTKYKVEDDIDLDIEYLTLGFGF
jgi:hypothetical protein